VREREKMEMAADLLAQVTKKCKLLVYYMKNKYPDDPRVIKLVENFNPQKISETLPTSELTAYSENKGQHLLVISRIFGKISNSYLKMPRQQIYMTQWITKNNPMNIVA
jgi:hypothetical protein